MKRSLLAGLGLGLVVAAAGVAWVVTRASQPPTEVAPSRVKVVTAPAPTATTPTTALGVCRFAVGQRLAFDVTSEVSVRLAPELARFGGAEAPRDSVNESQLTLEVLKVDGAGAVLLARAGGLEATAGDDVKAPWLARVNERCEVAGFARHVATTRSAARQQQALLHELWFSLAAATPRAVAFENSTGAAVGQVFADGSTLVRATQQYERVFVPSMNGVQVKRSRLEVKRGDGPWFDTMEGVEETSVPGVIQSGRAVLKVGKRTFDEAVLTTASRHEADYVWQNLLGAAPDGHLRANSMPEDHRQRMEAMRPLSLSTALDGMAGTIATGASVDQQWRDMAAFLDAHPEEISDFAEVVVTEFPANWKGVGYLALSHTENVEARELLLTVLRERNAPTIDRVRASLALVTRHDVGLPLAKELIAEARLSGGTTDQQDFGHQALLFAGMMTGLRPDEKPIQDEVHSGLAEQLTRPSWQELVPVYAAIGNTGDLSFLPDIDRASRHPDSDWRAVVPIALRRMPFEGVREFELGWLRRETSPDVLRELFMVIHRQHQDLGKTIDPELATLAVNYLRRQPHLLTRQTLLMMLEPWVALRPDVRAAFRDQLKIEYEATTGMFAFVASALPEEDVEAALATIPSLGDQYGAVSSTPPSSPGVPTSGGVPSTSVVTP